METLRSEVEDLEGQAADPNLWNDPDNAQRVTSRLSHKQAQLRRMDELRQRIDDLGVLHELAETEEDDSGRAEAAAELSRLAAAIDQVEVRTLLSGQYDQRNAVVTVRAEAGGVDAADWGRCCCACICVGPSGTVIPHISTTPPTPKRPGSNPRRSRSRLRMVTVCCRSNRVRTGSCGSHPSITRAAGRRRSLTSRYCRRSRRPTTSRFPRRTSVSTC